jgi:GntR family transcriptional repressor for pyruvate dehydrogenase complex
MSGSLMYSQVEGVDRPKKTAMILAEQIVHRIAASDYGAGSKLPPEREMMLEYGVGRGTLREALRFLELQGVIIVRAGPRGGPVVAAPSERQLASTLGILLEMDRTPYTDILAARITLEPVLAAEAARRISDSQLRQLRRECEEMRETLDRPELFTEQHHRFHRLVVEAAGNHVILLMMASLHWITEGSVPWSAFPARERKAFAEHHELILDALEKHDPEGAYQAILNEDQKYQRFVSRTQSEAMKQIVRWTSRA